MVEIARIAHYLLRSTFTVSCTYSVKEKVTSSPSVLTIKDRVVALWFLRLLILRIPGNMLGYCT